MLIRYESRPVMVTIKIYLRRYKEISTEGLVWIIFYVNREKINFSTGVKCNVKNWNEKKCCVGLGDKNSADKNRVIENIAARINDVFVKFRLRNKKLTKEGFLRSYNRPDDYDTFFAFVKDFKKKFSYKTESSTINVHTSVLNKIEEYQPNLHFDDITTDWLDQYYSHLRKKLKNCENTAYKNMSTFRKYVRAAWKAGYMDENPFENWRIKRTTASYTYLTENELSKLIELYRSGDLEEKLHKTLEFFLFMCFSSLHISDAKTLKLEQFNDDSFTYW